MAKEAKKAKTRKKAKKVSIPVSVPTENLIIRLQLKSIAVSEANSIRSGLELLLETILGKEAVEVTESINFIGNRSLGDIVRQAEKATIDSD